MYTYRRDVRDINLIKYLTASEFNRIIRFQLSVLSEKLHPTIFLFIPVMISTSAIPNPVSDLGDKSMKPISLYIFIYIYINSIIQIHPHGMNTAVSSTFHPVKRSKWSVYLQNPSNIASQFYPLSKISIIWTLILSCLSILIPDTASVESCPWLINSLIIICHPGRSSTTRTCQSLFTRWRINTSISSCTLFKVPKNEA